MPFHFAVSTVETEAGSGAGAIIKQDGRFVAEDPGVYTILVRSGHQSSVRTIRVVPRGVAREVTLVGKGLTPHTLSSDFWVWEGIDGRDYAITGTNYGTAKAYFWDVTDPANLIMIDSVEVNARNVNDVKVSEDGTLAVITREGASNRKNGIVILDVSNPHDVQIITEYTEGLTGGVHNVFIYENHVYALSNGQRYDIINIEDPKNPRTVGRFEIGNPARSIHDVWVVDGIAYSSNWSDGVVIVDVGNGIAGGSPSNPVEIARSKVDGDANHAAFPYYSEATGKF
ncbi:MAG: LpqB family beta-propeller domain-containing protein, partial [Saprospiraceae bacterium]|nr:LpqB family beta-propeller domain-containing protein [Saprospiraceae bacterium]